MQPNAATRTTAARRAWGSAALAALVLTGATCGTTSAKAKPLQVVTADHDVTAAVDKFRALLGPDNGDKPGGNPNGHREISWDGVPDEFASPNALPADFFNAKDAPRARGAHLESPGGGHVAVSARPDNAARLPLRFGDINPTYAEQFTTFSSDMLFSPIGGNSVDVTFRVPGTETPAVVRGFGAVYTDVDRKEGAADAFAKAGLTFSALLSTDDFRD